MKIKVLRPALAPSGKRRLLQSLATALADPAYDRCRIIVAFAKLNGVQRLQPHISALRARGGRVEVIVGVDLRGTSKEALELLIATTDAAYVTMEPDPRCTFHPKMYMLDGKSDGLAFVGSHNLTRGGLEVNYEAALAVHLTFPDEHEIWLKNFEASWEELLPAHHTSTAPLDAALIALLVAAGVVVPEAQMPKPAGAKASAGKVGVKLPFVSAGVVAATGVAPAPKATAAAPPAAPAAKATPAAPAAPGAVVWRKVLSATDAQRQVGHYTGDLRLAAAKFKVGGTIIDQTQYFRNTVFAKGSWIVATTSPLVETADFDFDITILGKKYGVKRLTVSHKPSGEAGQGNYTTGIRWGDLKHELRSKVDVRNKTLTLSAPPAGTTGPYVISIA